MVSRRKRNAAAGVAAFWQAVSRQEPPVSTLVGSLVGTVISARRYVDG